MPTVLRDEERMPLLLSRNRFVNAFRGVVVRAFCGNEPRHFQRRVVGLEDQLRCSVVEGDLTEILAAVTRKRPLSQTSLPHAKACLSARLRETTGGALRRAR